MALGINEVHQGDCIQNLAALRAGSVELVFADPPFNIGYEYDTYDDRRDRADYLAWSKKWIQEVARVLKSDGTFWLAIGDEYAAELKLIAQEEAGFSCRSWVLWYYTFGVNCARGFSRSHTHLLHFVKDPDHFTFNHENPAIRVPSARQLVYRDARANPKGRLPDNTWIYRPQDAPEGAFSTMHDTWFFSRVAGTFKEREGFHGCQMPEQLLGRIVRISSNPQDLVLDPFAGSGTTVVVAKKLGRQWMGMELSEDYVEHMNQRLAKTSVGDPLDGPADPVKSAPKTSAGKKRRDLKMRNGKIIPLLDEETKEGIIKAYQQTCQDLSTDELLCNREKDKEFAAACRQQKLRGDVTMWNHFLLRIRKAGDLPKLKKSGPKRKLPHFDEYSFASEIAAHLMSVNYDLSLDEVLCSPAAADEFDELAQKLAPGFSSSEYRWGALTIRKRGKTSRTLAKKHFSEWQTQSLPKAIPLEECHADEYHQPGAYVFLNKAGEVIYVGETASLQQRAAQIVDNTIWLPFKIKAVHFIPCKTPHGLQSALIQRFAPGGPLLNWTQELAAKS